MSVLAYKPNADEVMEGLRALYERCAQDSIFAIFHVPNRALAAYTASHEEGYCEYPDPRERIAYWNAYCSERVALEDDSIPHAYLSEFDQGLSGGMLGAEVQFMCHPYNGYVSSMVAPLRKSLDECESLAVDKTHPWFRRYLEHMRVYAEGSAGKFGISHMVLINHFNFIFELVGGTLTYMGMLDQPEKIVELTELAFKMASTVQDAFFENVPLVNGGTCSILSEWIPGRIISESVDPFHMTSAADFEKWGREPIERLIGRYDGGNVHIHGNGRHLLEAVASIKGLKAMYVGDDKGFPRACDILPEVRRRTGDMPLAVQIHFPVFAKRLETRELTGGVLYQVTGAPGADAANRLMEEVRSYRA